LADTRPQIQTVGDPDPNTDADTDTKTTMNAAQSGGHTGGGGGSMGKKGSQMEVIILNFIYHPRRLKVRVHLRPKILPFIAFDLVFIRNVLPFFPPFTIPFERF